MPGATPRGYPYPLGTEPADGSANIEALARAVDGDLTADAAGRPLVQSGYVTLTGTLGAAPGGLDPGNNGLPATITFPAPFKQAPVVICNIDSNGYMFASAHALTDTGFVPRGYCPSNSRPALYSFRWIAVGIRP